MCGCAEIVATGTTEGFALLCQAFGQVGAVGEVSVDIKVEFDLESLGLAADGLGLNGFGFYGHGLVACDGDVVECYLSAGAVAGCVDRGDDETLFAVGLRGECEYRACDPFGRAVDVFLDGADKYSAVEILCRSGIDIESVAVSLKI